MGTNAIKGLSLDAARMVEAAVKKSPWAACKRSDHRSVQGYWVTIIRSSDDQVLEVDANTKISELESFIESKE